MKHIWSPWRMKYLEGHATQKGCIFCEALQQSDEPALIVRRGKQAFVLLNRYPYTGGHLMVVPHAHTRTVEDLTEETVLEMHRLTRQSLAALRKVYGATSFNLGVNIGEPAGAGVADHVHLHIVPRWNGDTNFMTTLGGVRVLPEELGETWRKLLEAWD
jgi:ATP adenylyltransferase